MSLLDEMGGSLEDWVDDPDQLREDYIEDNDIDEEDIDDIGDDELFDGWWEEGWGDAFVTKNLIFFSSLVIMRRRFL